MVSLKDFPQTKREAATHGAIVWCVLCIYDGQEATHIFSSRERAEAFCAKDAGRHVVYDYVIDVPERMSQASN